MSKRYCENCKNVIDETEECCSECLMPVEMMDRWPMDNPCLKVDWRRRSTDNEPNEYLKKAKQDWGDVQHGIRSTPMDTQVGGSHYKNMAIQPVEFNQRNKMPYCEANAIKYICRHRDKNGKEDIDKAIHYLQLLKELEYGE